MPRIDPNLVPVVTDLERGLRQLGIPFGIVGALVPELLLTARPRRMTNDADVTVVVDNLADFNVRARRCRRPVNSGQPFHGGRQWPLRCGEATIPIHFPHVVAIPLALSIHSTVYARPASATAN